MLPLGALALGGAALAGTALLLSPPQSETLKMISAKRKSEGSGKFVIVGDLRFPDEPAFPSGPLPTQAILASAAPKFVERNNDIHIKDHWFQFGVYSKDWFKKRAKLRFYSGPKAGSKYVKQEVHHRNVCFMARCPDPWYPGVGSAQLRNCRVSAISQWISVKADWKSGSDAFKTSIKGIPAVLKASMSR